MNFDSIEKRLTRKYEQKVVEGVSCFVKEGAVVATKENGCVVMYFRCEPSSHKVIWNHHGIVAVAVVKDFQLVEAVKTQYRVTMADVVVVEGLCGACNTIKKTSNMLLNVTVDFNFEYPKYAGGQDLKIGTIGYVKQRGVFEFDDFKMKLEVSKDMCEYDDIALNYSILKLKSNRRMKRNPKYIDDKHYNVHQILKERNSWYWNGGYKNVTSPECRRKIDHTRWANYHKLGNATLTICQN